MASKQPVATSDASDSSTNTVSTPGGATVSRVGTVSAPGGATISRVGDSAVQSYTTFALNTSVNTPTIEYVAQTSSLLTNAMANGHTVFTFHDTLNDLLATGALGQLNNYNIHGLLGTLPADWQSKYSQDSNSLDDLLLNIQGLLSLSHDIWNGNPSGFGASGWAPPTPFYQPTGQPPAHNTYTDPSVPSSNNDLNRNRLSMKENMDSEEEEKQGMSDHPDYLGRVGEAYTGYELGYGGYQLGQTAYNAVTTEGGVANLGQSVIDTGTKYLNNLTGGAEEAEEGEAGLETAGELGEVAEVAEIGGTAAEVGEVAAAGLAAVAAPEVIGAVAVVGAVGLAAAGLAVGAYDIYKALGGTGNIPVLDNIGDTVHSAFGWLGF
jgi:hypothetical protein